MKQFAALASLVLFLPVQAQVTHTIHVMDDEFSPPEITINMGDHIHLLFDDDNHTFTQVEQATWIANDDTPMAGGYEYGTGTTNPGADFTFTPTVAGMLYYICEFHVDMGMKGTITVLEGTGVYERSAVHFLTAPNPASDRVQLLGERTAPVELILYDASGQLALIAIPDAGNSVDVSALANGVYVMVVQDRDQQILDRQPLVVAR